MGSRAVRAKKSARKEAEKEVKQKEEPIGAKTDKAKPKSIEKKKSKKEESQTLPITDFFVDSSAICLSIVIALVVFCAGLTMFMGWDEPTPRTDRDFLIWDDPMTVNYDKTVAARQILKHQSLI